MMEREMEGKRDGGGGAAFRPTWVHGYNVRKKTWTGHLLLATVNQLTVISALVQLEFPSQSSEL